ncbi:hypothetical protein CLV71_110280 [Actinophytocola oryzae]|uniref:PEGA domain-containing protein n=2 Tax=Actinophytocola oryzae TaxID=502181 RepID=A0A4R7VD79_9PSEU|nr:hypothetical protein CLV71_110280 [Actinophytocola oryzae]
MGRLLLHTAYNPMAFLLALTGPRVTINGQPANVRWGEVAFNLPAGNHHLRVTTRYLGDFGPAELPVAIYPGQVTTVYYRPPATKGMKGAIGFTPQPTRMASVIAINVVIVLAAIAVIVFTRLN